MLEYLGLLDYHRFHPAAVTLTTQTRDIYNKRNLWIVEGRLYAEQLHVIPLPYPAIALCTDDKYQPHVLCDNYQVYRLKVQQKVYNAPGAHLCPIGMNLWEWLRYLDERRAPVQYVLRRLRSQIEPERWVSSRR